jgi:hypothetical protein
VPAGPVAGHAGRLHVAGPVDVSGSLVLPDDPEEHRDEEAEAA